MLTMAQKQFEDHLRDNVDDIDWTIICRHYNLSTELIDDLYEYMDWGELNWNLISGVQQLFDSIEPENLTFEQLTKHISILKETNIDTQRDNICKFLRDCGMQKLYTRTVSDEFLEEYSGFIDWELLTEFTNLSDEFIRKFSEDLDWETLSYRLDLSWAIIREFKDKLDWGEITVNYEFDIDKLREFRDDIDWYSISIEGNLSIDIIREFKDELDWEEFSEKQIFDEQSAYEFKDLIDWGATRYDLLSETFIRALMNDEDIVLDWYEISKMPYLSNKFIEEFKDDIEWDQYLFNPKTVPIIVFKYKDRCTNHKQLSNVLSRLVEQMLAYNVFAPYLPSDIISTINGYL